VRLLDTSGRQGGGLAGSLGGELLTGGLATSGLACEECVSGVMQMWEDVDVVMWQSRVVKVAFYEDCDGGDDDDEVERAMQWMR